MKKPTGNKYFKLSREEEIEQEAQLIFNRVEPMIGLKRALKMAQHFRRLMLIDYFAGMVKKKRKHSK